MTRCECEHLAHLEKGIITPNGNPGHKYGATFSQLHMQVVETPYGSFYVCSDCAHDCLANLN